MNTTLIFSAVLLAFAVNTTAQTSVTTVAVNDLIPHGVDMSEASIISDRLRSELFKTGAYTVVERGQMDMILEEQSFQQTCICDA